jgi:hypothetical protein
MLKNAMLACPEEIWRNRNRKPEFWYIAYHTLFLLDFYLSENAENFTPPPSFTISELDPGGVLPDRVYSKQELSGYLEYGQKNAGASFSH